MSRINRLDLALRMLVRTDPVMKRLAEKTTLREFTDNRTPFESLVHAVIYQQLSGVAAKSVFDQFLGMFGNRFPTPSELRHTSIQHLRKCGMSRRKAEYLKEIAGAAEQGVLERERLEAMPDNEIIKVLDGIRGVGPWTVQMLLIFVLRRPDVFPSADLGLRKAIKMHYGLARVPSENETEEFAKRWKPYRSTASLLLWRSLDATPWP